VRVVTRLFAPSKTLTWAAAHPSNSDEQRAQAMSKRTVCTAIAVVAALVFGGLEARAGIRVGVLGDSYSDEYQFYSPHRSKARNWVEILASTRSVDFGEFRSSSWSEPRNQGYAYNWAKSGATTSSMIADKQHEGLAAQVARGEVAVAVVFVGGNDFIEALSSSDPRSKLSGLGRSAFTNVRTATDTLLGASPNVKLIVTTVPDIRELPEFRQALRQGKLEPSFAALATAEIEIFNGEIRRLQTSGGRVACFDFAAYSRISQLISPRHITVGSRKVERERVGNTPDRLFLGDSRHLGTLAQGLLAKYMVEALNRSCDAKIKPLDEHELVQLADSVAEPAIAANLKEDGSRP
jgi:phospholipase/lecithinase/hemolysin